VFLRASWLTELNFLVKVFVKFPEEFSQDYDKTDRSNTACLHSLENIRQASDKAIFSFINRTMLLTTIPHRDDVMSPVDFHQPFSLENNCRQLADQSLGFDKYETMTDDMLL
jgi:hypothetical protein